jgi:hypothetical protein
MGSHKSSRKNVDVFDPHFKFVKEVPSCLVRHLPPARLNITRLVFCRNYVPGEEGSCSMADGCKFVHADVDPESLESHPIHVKYAWRHEDLCTYARLPAGEVLRVTAPNNRPPVEEIPSERVLVTRGGLRYRNPDAVHHHCMHYHQHRMCNRGERCNFIHVVHVDAKVVGDFKRAAAAVVEVHDDVLEGSGYSIRRCSMDSQQPATLCATVSCAGGCSVRNDSPSSLVAKCEEGPTVTFTSLPSPIMHSSFHHNPYRSANGFRSWVL